VTTLNTQLETTIDHDEFVKALLEEFEEVYALPKDGKMERKTVRERDMNIDKALNGIKEIKVRGCPLWNRSYQVANDH